ncbi:unnamed protein product [Moneuplotes crassus]|uniref:Uncharacterized protein n=1 Tax=Euplotes crassus TaxID=5936 RepID=A0AAD1XGE2_EUPCR|nr:unnamed protein product [Moneuplotes crassus]
MDKKIIKGLKKSKLLNKDYQEALNRLKQASVNTRGNRKSKFDGLTTDKILSSGISKHSRHASQGSNPQMRNIGKILSPNRANNRSTNIRRKGSLVKGMKFSKSKGNKLQLNYITPLPNPKETNLKNKRYNSTHKLTEKDAFPYIRSKIKHKGLHSYLSSANNLPTQLSKGNSRKSRLMNKSTEFIIKTQTKGKDAPTMISSSMNSEINPNKSLFDLVGSVTSQVENVEEIHFMMVKIHQAIRNSVEKIEKKNSAIVLEDESTLKNFK